MKVLRAMVLMNSDENCFHSTSRVFGQYGYDFDGISSKWVINRLKILKTKDIDKVCAENEIDKGINGMVASYVSSKNKSQVKGWNFQSNQQEIRPKGLVYW